MSEWRECKLGELADVKGGKRLPKGELLVNYETSHPYIRVTDLGKKWIRKNGLQFVPNEIQKRISRYIVNKGEVILSIVGSIGFTGRISEELDKANLTENCVRFVLKSNNIESDFLYYFFASRIGQEEIEKRSVGSTQPKLPLYNIKDIEINLPPLPEQTAIAEVLSSLDDKIDLLHRQNKTLEQLAETLFRQWFVESEKLEMKSEKLGDAIKTTSGGTPSRNKMEYFATGTIRWVKSKELAGSFIFETEEMITEDALKNSSAKILPANSILIAMYGATVGEFGILANEATCNQAVCALIPNENYPYTYLFLLTKNNKENLLNLAVGSAQQNISQLLIKEIEISADTELIKEFHNETEQMFQKIKSNTNQIKTLTRLRDTLLPKLMSGEVRVKS